MYCVDRDDSVSELVVRENCIVLFNGIIDLTDKQLSIKKGVITVTCR